MSRAGGRNVAEKELKVAGKDDGVELRDVEDTSAGDEVDSAGGERG